MLRFREQWGLTFDDLNWLVSGWLLSWLIDSVFVVAVDQMPATEDSIISITVLLVDELDLWTWQRVQKSRISSQKLVETSLSNMCPIYHPSSEDCWDRLRILRSQFIATQIFTQSDQKGARGLDWRLKAVHWSLFFVFFSFSWWCWECALLFHFHKNRGSSSFAWISAGYDLLLYKLRFAVGGTQRFSDSSAANPSL